VFARQWELRRTMIEYCACPSDRRVARLTRLWETSRRMVGIRRLLEVRQVASRARRTQPGKLPANVAARAVGSHVLPCKGESRLCMIELGPLPLDGRVARTAVR
jgi:hypothetical protein